MKILLQAAYQRKRNVIKTMTSGHDPLLIVFNLQIDFPCPASKVFFHL